MMDGYRRRPLYSADNEDTRSELKALEIGGDDTVVAIAAGGGRALSLLTAGPKRLIAIDRRPEQVFNLELKAAAMDAFDLAHFQGFLGARMSLQFTWQGSDSALAAPLVLDLARLTDFAAERGESGVMAHTASFFKSPLAGGEHDFYSQHARLLEYARRHHPGG